MADERLFEKDYWDKNYSDLDEMDGVVNAMEHARYAKSFFDVEFLQVNTIIDLGFGLGEMLKAFTSEFKPNSSIGVEPSIHAYNKLLAKKWHNQINTRFFNMDLLTWSKTNKKLFKSIDLGICTSVFQYLSDEEITEILPILSKRVRYLYFSVPTDVELKRQREELEFNDEYAIRRSRTKYLKLLSPHYTVISARILESKFHFDADSTGFTDLLFRF